MPILLYFCISNGILLIQYPSRKGDWVSHVAENKTLADVQRIVSDYLDDGRMDVTVEVVR